MGFAHDRRTCRGVWSVRIYWISSLEVIATLGNPNHCRKMLPGWHGEQIRVTELATELDLKPLIQGCSAVVNLAGHAHTFRESEPLHSSKCYAINAEFPRRLASACCDLNVPRLLHVSSLHAVASEADEVLNELTSPRPKSAYGESKLAGENVLRLALAKSRTAWTILRPPLVYGEGNPANMAKLIRIIRQANSVAFRQGSESTELYLRAKSYRYHPQVSRPSGSRQSDPPCERRPRCLDAGPCQDARGDAKNQSDLAAGPREGLGHSADSARRPRTP